MIRTLVASLVPCVTIVSLWAAGATVLGPSALPPAAGQEEPVAAPCDPDGVRASWTVGYGGGSFGVWAVTISEISEACRGAVLTVALGTDGDPAGVSVGGPVLVTGEEETLRVCPVLRAEDVTRIRVDGIQLVPGAPIAAAGAQACHVVDEPVGGWSPASSGAVP